MPQMDGQNEGRTDDVLEMVSSQVESAVSAIVDGIVERPWVGAAIVAGFVGALAGVALADRTKPKPKVPQGPGMSEAAQMLGAVVAALGSSDLRKRAKSVTETVEKSMPSVGKRSRKLMPQAMEAGDAAALVMRLLSNPLVRGVIVQQVRKRMQQRGR